MAKRNLDINPTMLDMAIGLVSPSTMQARIKSRVMTQMFVEQARMYNAGTHSRRTADWKAPGTSSNTELHVVLPTLINRSRDLVRNNPTAKRAVQAIADNVTGLGIRPCHSKDAGSKTANKGVKAAWADWAESTNCDWDGKNNFYGLQRLVAHTICQSGSCLIRKRWQKNASGVHMQIQVMEPDFIDRTRDMGSKAIEFGKPYNLLGRQFDGNGKLIGFHLHKTHPGDGWIGESVFVSTDEVLHIYDVERPGQIDGVPVLTTSAMTMKDFDEYEQAQLVRQKIAACFAVFITDSDGTGGLPGDDKTPGSERLEPGIIQRIDSGKTVTFTTPPTVQNYDEYATAMLRKIASGIGLSYEVLTGDLSNVNFSSGRMGWIEFHRLIQRWQYLILVPQMCEPIYKWFLDACIISGVIKSAPKGKATWTPPRREMIDPAKEVKALIEMIRSGLKPWSEAMREMGQDPEDAVTAIIDDFKELRKYDLYLTCDPKFDAARSNGPLLDPNAGNDTGGDAGTAAEEQTGKQKKKLRSLGVLNEGDD